MVAENPEIEVIEKANPMPTRPGMANKCALIGAFDSEETNPQLFIDLDDAYTALGTDKTKFKGVACLDKLFNGATSILAVNITTKTGETVNTELTPEKLASALAKIKGEDFDMLFVAEDLQDTAFPIITQFLDESAKMKCPAGYMAGVTRANNGAYITTLGLAGNHCYGIICGQQYGVNGKSPMSVVESAAYLAGIVLGLNVGNSMTMKTIPGVTSVSPEYTFENGDAGLALLQAGAVTVKCLNRGAGNFVWVNSEQPNGLDLYINRVRDFVIKEMSLHKFLGNRNRKPTQNEIEHELTNIRDQCVTTLDLLEDIQYNVVKKSPKCVDINLTKLVFAGIITHIRVFYTVEVQ